MELWLIVGALVLVALTVWIVWTPQRARDAEESPMNDPNRPNMTPQGNAFEDQYTSATADLSAGGVATAREAGQFARSAANRVTDTAAQMTERVQRSEPWSSPGMAREGTPQPWTAMAHVDSMNGQRRMLSLSEPRTIGIGGALIGVASGVAGAWLYGRWQHERNKPINRLRRGAQGFASLIGDRLPDTEDLPESSGPIGGTAAALLVSSLVLARAMRRSDGALGASAERSGDVFSNALAMGREQARRMGALDALEIGRGQAVRRWREFDLQRSLEANRKQMRKLEAKVEAEKSKPGMLGGLGLGGAALIAGVGFVIWRLMRGSREPDPSYYVGERATTD
jgi:hypothetical protein